MPSSEATATYEPGWQADQRLLDRGWLRIGAAAAVAAQSMVFSLAVNLSEISGWARFVVHGILILAALLTLFLLGGDLLHSAGDSLRERRISIDLLFLVTLLGAFAGSLLSTFTGVGSVYYEVVAVLIVVHTFGKMLGAKSRAAALRAVDATRERFETCQLVLPEGAIVARPIKSIQRGDRVRIDPGGAIAVDGEIVSGRGYISETSMTGEWKPVAKGPGERVFAGTYSVDGTFVICAAGGRRRLDEILDVVAGAKLAPSRLQQQADRLIAWFLPLVVLVCAGTFAFWLRLGPWQPALFNSMAVLLVACPCAMGLATPVAIWSGLANLAGFGLVARTGDFVDVLSRADAVLIDKTGTLSEDTLAVLDWRVSPEFVGQSELIKAVAAVVEAGLQHPVAQALAKDMAAASSSGIEVESRTLIPGRGVVAQVRLADGSKHLFAIGERELGAAPVEGLEQLRGKNVWLFFDGRWAASLLLQERWRQGLDESFRNLQTIGVRVEVLSGDPAARAQLPHEIPVSGGLTPAQKKARVESCVQAGETVVYVGDGVNDSAAMSVAHASVAMRGGDGLARAAALAVFGGSDLRFLPEAVKICRTARKKVRANLYFAAGYNAVGMTLASAGWLHPVAAALLMVGSSLFVSINALSRRGFLTNAAR